jgi:hypothetical protein
MDLKKRAKQTSPTRKSIAVSIKLFYKERQKECLSFLQPAKHSIGLPYGFFTVLHPLSDAMPK